MSDVENSANPKVQTSNARAHFCETLVLLSLTLLGCGFAVLADDYLFWWTASCVAASLLSLSAAFIFSRKALETYQLTKFEVTDQTIRTLEAIKAPSDLYVCLVNRRGRDFESEGAFFGELDTALGTERCAELKGTIFKYTKNTASTNSPTPAPTSSRDPQK